MTETTYPDALRRLADFIETHPELSIGPNWHETWVSATPVSLDIHIHAASTADEKAAVRSFVRAIGGTWEKGGNDQTLYLTQQGVFGFFDATIFADRAATCERVVVGTETIIHEAQDARTEIREIVEWDCGSLLAVEADAA